METKKFEEWIKDFETEGKYFHFGYFKRAMKESLIKDNGLTEEQAERIINLFRKTLGE